MPKRPDILSTRGEARRAELLEAAIEVVAESGVGGATHRAVASRAGVPLSTTSYFFDSLDELIAAALQVAADRLVSDLDAQIKRISDARPGVDEAVDPFVDLLMNARVNDVVAQFEIYLECPRRPVLQATAHQIMSTFERAAESALRALGVTDAAERAPMVVE